jgi:hypothetical protein
MDNPDYAIGTVELDPPSPLTVTMQNISGEPMKIRDNWNPNYWRKFTLVTVTLQGAGYYPGQNPPPTGAFYDEFVFDPANLPVDANNPAPGHKGLADRTVAVCESNAGRLSRPTEFG